MKICLLSYRGNPYCGGQGIYISYLARELIKLGHEVHLLVGPPYPLSTDGAKLHKIHNFNFYNSYESFKSISNPLQVFSPLHFYELAAARIGFFPEMFAFSFRSFNRITELLETEKFDIIHDNQCLGYGLLLMKSLGIPVISTVHHPLHVDRAIEFEHHPRFGDKYRRVLYYPLLMQKFVTKRLDRIITVSESSAADIHRYFNVPSKKIRVVYNGVDTDVFQKSNGVPKDTKRLIFVGNTDDRKKGILYLLQAMRGLGDDVKLTIVDGGAPRKKFAPKVVSNYGLEDRVTFTGKIESTTDLAKLYSVSNIAIVPSLYEGFGFPAAEAMSCGLPVIASNISALPEVVGNGDCGILVPPRDSDALASGIKRLLGDEELMTRMGQSARKRVQRLFSWEEAAKKVISVYEEVVGAYR